MKETHISATIGQQFPVFMTDRTRQILSIAFLASIILFGLFTFLYYVGMPVHRGSLIDLAVSDQIDKQCTWRICQGVLGLWPMVSMFTARLIPFVPYLILSALFGGGFLLWQVMKQGSTFNLTLRMKPWHIGGAFLLSLWLLALGFTFTKDGNLSFRDIVEPTASVYADASENGLAALQANFKDLKDKGCLRLIGQADSQTGIYRVSHLCFQRFFVTRVLSQALVAGVFLFELLILGGALLSLFNTRPRRLLHEGLLSLGVGTFAWVAILWSVAVAGIFDANVGWLLVLCVPIACYRMVLYWGQKFLWHTWEVHVKPWDAAVILFWLIITYLAINFFVVVRPFPIGWDDLGSYINRPRLLVSYGHFLPSMASFQWEYLTSLGFLLFGYSNPFGATASLIINWTEGLLALLVTYAFGQVLFGKKGGLLTALVFYSLPVIGHFSFADMKIDNAVYFMGALAMLTLFQTAFPKEETEDEVNELPHYSWKLLLLAGLFAGLGFGFKVTAIMVFMGMLVALVGSYFGWIGAAGSIFLSLAILVNRGALSISKILDRLQAEPSPLLADVISWLLLLLALGTIGYSVYLKGRDVAVHAGKSALFLFAGFAIAVFPWILHNNILVGNIIPKPIFTAPNTFTGVDVSPFNKESPKEGVPAELYLDTKNAACVGTSGSEELDRYWGNTKGIGHYLFLPWRSVMNVDNGGYYITTVPALLLFPLLLLVPIFWNPKRRKLRYVMLATAFVVLQWIFLANGVLWYGVGMFLGLALAMEAFVACAPNRTAKWAAGTVVGLSIFLAFGMRLWQFDMQKNLIEYPMGKISAKALEERTIPWYGLISQLVVQRNKDYPKQSKLYRAGTFIPYFIPKNLDIIATADNQLDLFNCLNQERDASLTLKRLQYLGINSIIFDTNTATIERDMNGTLHKKVNYFVDFVNTTGLGMQIAVADPDAGLAFILLPILP